ncbi:hypothetical protein BRD00_12950 [Halobacteriales archaeon QS_8_69_26]|nr:MAG: hypothetical protein BRD00_12950 [Halobacteriales archaeon QS_8_69_26]
MNGQRVLDRVAKRAGPGGGDEPIPGGGVGVEVGRNIEDAADVEWRDWPSFLEEFDGQHLD